MADSIALKIQKAVETRLKLASVTIGGEVFNPPANLTVERERIGLIQPKHVQDGPLIVIHMGGQNPTARDHYKSPMLRRVLKLTAVIAASADAAKNSDALDPATNWVIQALQSEPTLGNLAHWISEEGQDDYYTFYDDSSLVVAQRELALNISFHTRTDNPEARS